MIETKDNSISRSSARLMLCAVFLLIVGIGGCYKRTIAPAVEFDQTQVDAITREIEKLDWE